MYERYVAMGDSFTEGLDDPRPDGSFRGWADLVAADLATRSPGFRYANLAVRSRRLGAIRDEQLAPAVAMHPDLITIAAGANDITGWRCDTEALARTGHAFLQELVATGAHVLAFTGYRPHLWLPLGGVIRGRISDFNVFLRASCAELGITLVDLELMPELYRDGFWARDRLHLSPSGHALVANEVLRALGSPGAGDVTADDERPRSWVGARTEDVRWGVEHFAPWLGRRLRGRSAGDHIDPKRPVLTAWQGSTATPAG